MITGMGNLGPPLKATPDLKANRRGEEPRKSGLKDQEDSRSDSFERTLGTKLSKDKTEGKLPPELRESRPPDRAEKSEMRESRMENKIGRSEDSKDETSPNDTVKAKSAGETKEVAKGLSDRQRVMQKFMDSMESEFGIPPQRIVEAMAQLSDKELLLSPEDTASTVIDQLEMDPQESLKAEAMYIAMLGTLGSTLPMVKDPEPLSTGQKSALAAGGLLHGAQPMKLLSSRERREALNNSLDQMNSKFFIKPGQTPAVDSKASLATDNSATGFKDLSAQSNLGTEAFSQKSQALANYQRTDFAKDMPPGKVTDAVPTGPQPAADPRMASLTDQMEPMTEEETNAAIMKGLAALGIAAGAVSQALKDDPANAAALKMERGQTGAGAEMNGAMAAGLQQGQTQTQGAQGSSAKNGQGSSGGKGKDSGRDSESGLQSLTSASTSAPSFFVDPRAADVAKSPLGHEAAAHANANTAALAGGGAAGAAANASKSEDEANIQQVLSQAKYMIKKGGGEAVVKMNPEGMGQVHLKVLVSEGKVNVEMQTETKEAKKLLESSLMDLKTSMNTHKLAIDHVKVDVNNGLASDNKQEQQPQQRDMGREQARQFLGQFKEENLGNRDAFYETTGIKAYGSSRKTVDPLKPADSVNSEGIRRYQGSGKGSAVDLVA